MRNTLLPQAYVVRSGYKTDTLYRATFLALILACVLGLVFAVAERNVTTENKVDSGGVASADAARTDMETHRRKLRKVIEGYSMVKKWESYKRLPITPLLDAVEKTIPPESCITDMKLEMPRIVSGELRKMDVKMTIFVDAAAGSDKAVATDWLNSMAAKLPAQDAQIEKDSIKTSIVSSNANGMTVEMTAVYAQKN